MSLWHIGSNHDLTALYKPYVGPYCQNYYPPKPWPDWFKGVYRQSIDPQWAKVFLYIPSIDCYCLWTVVRDYPNDMSIFKDCSLTLVLNLNKVFVFRAEDGAVIDWDYIHEPTPIFPPKFWAIWGGAMGSFEKIYVVYTSWADPRVYEVNWRDLNYDGGWYLSSYDTDPPTTFGAWGPFAIVNRQDDYIAWGNNRTLNLFRLENDDVWRRWKIITTQAEMQHVCWENRENCWWISTVQSGSKIGKLNYRLGRHEIMSSVQSPYEDVVKQFVAFDAKRKRVAVLRLRPDDPDTGACRFVLDFYRPLIRASKIYGITDPVPLSKPRVGTRTTFVSYLIGDIGEPVPPHVVDAELTAPAEGRLLMPHTMTNEIGRSYTQYLGVEAGDERLNLSCEVTDGFREEEG